MPTPPATARRCEAWRNRNDVLSPEANSYEQLVVKFKDNVVFSGLVTGERAGAMIEAIENLDEFETINEFVDSFLVFEK